MGVATTLASRSVICPIGGESFQALRLLSFLSVGMYLDHSSSGMELLRQKAYARPPEKLPRTIAGVPPPLPRCPGNGFVMYKEKFTQNELIRLKAFVETKQYRALYPRHSDYFVAAKLMEHVNADPREIAGTLLQATWEAKDDKQYADYACAALRAYNRSLERSYVDLKQWIFDQLIAGEMERRLSQFGAAKKRFTALIEFEAIRWWYERDIALLQIKLIDARDSERHLMPN